MLGELSTDFGLFIPSSKVNYGDLENIKTDHVNTVVFNLHEIKQFFGTPGRANRCTFRILGGGVTVMEKREILVGWVTKVCLKCTERAGVGREGDI